MSLHDHDCRSLLCGALQVALALGAASCGASTAPSPPQAPGVAEMQGREEPAVFQLWAAAGTRFTWTERRSFDTAIAGTNVADRDQSELHWDVSVQRPSPPGITVIDERLVRVSFDHDGRTVVSGAPDAVIQLVIDSGGTLERMDGLDAASKAVRALAAPGMQPVVDRLYSSDALATLLRNHVQLLIGDLVGRPNRENATWIAAQRPGDNALFTRYTVESPQPCAATPDGTQTACTQLHVWADVQPRAAAALASSLVERITRLPARETAPGPEGAPARYVTWGTLLVQPATLLPAAATLHEAGHVSLVSGGKPYRVELRALTEDRFEYGAQNVALR